MDFTPSPAFSVGMELELQLLDPHTLNLTDAVLPLLATYPDQSFVKPEFLQNTVEVVSPVTADLSELETSLRTLLRELLGHLDGLGLGVCGAGTHPFNTQPALFTPGERYRLMEKSSGWLGQNQVTFATHVHLGLPGGEEAVTLMRELKPFLPLLVALSASSPCWHGSDTRFAAFRHRVLAASRSYGIPPDFPDWPAFERFFAAMARARVLHTARDLHWDLRPCPHFGTLEVRVMDAQPTLSEALALAALLRALVRCLQASRGSWTPPAVLAPQPWWTLRDNCFIASRDGLEARLIASQEGELMSLRAIADQVLAWVRPWAAADERPWLDRLDASIAAGLPYARQRRRLRRGGGPREVVAALSREFRADLNASPA
ncbi:YbdK family carboxylate-amine ligase [Cyanobium sp. CH-040]|uniref:carboxylate-amine ligase n=1 Tax=Cyanobium sp. CH-040 TaxID=2823708 RepID=UPI0020CF2F39|nr:YbdK family carboxylate-amine ligase [Cyanobium sp. CH-040]MCP9927529.1 YbdK family carboxylate-amine ligase [Cyanobium sp. CH-040]